MNDITPGIDMHDAESGLVANRDGSLGLLRQQEISDHFLADLRDDRLRSSNSRMGNFHKVASIPTSIVEKWKREGFDIFDKNVTLKDIIRKLNSQDMQNLLATTKRVT